MVLVTHFMEEAERLCDRMAIIDHGRIVALDTPADLVRGLQAGPRVRFTAANGFDSEWLRSVPGAEVIVRQGQEVVVSGSGPLMARVAAALAEHEYAPPDLRPEQATLEDVFLSLTGREFQD